jgi:hypothetical protein
MNNHVDINVLYVLSLCGPIEQYFEMEDKKTFLQVFNRFCAEVLHEARETRVP